MKIIINNNQNCLNENITNKKYIKEINKFNIPVTSHLGLGTNKELFDSLEYIENNKNTEDLRLLSLPNSLINSNRGDFIDKSIFPSLY